MAATAMKHMTLIFFKLDKFEGVDFRRWQKKIHFLLSSMSVVYVPTTPFPDDDGDDPTVEQNVKSSKELWDSLEAKYMVEDASILEQYNELLGILKRFTQHKINMDEAVQVSCIIDKLPHSWKDFKHTLKYEKEELTLVKLGSHLRIEESLGVQDSDKPKGNNVHGPSVVNMVEHNNSSGYNDNKGKRKHHDNTSADPNKKAKPTCWKCGKTGHIKRDCKGVNVGNKSQWIRHKRMMMWRGGLTQEQQFMCAKIDVEALDKFKVFKTEVKLQQGSLIKRFKTDSGGEYMNILYLQSVGIIHEMTAPYTPQQNGISERKNKQPEPELRKSKRNRTLKNFGPEFQLYLIEGTRDEVSDQYSYSFNVEDDLKTFDEAIKSQDVAF
ncbi:zinc finger, CCHC-type containing protein [Tanacetum coccineum]